MVVPSADNLDSSPVRKLLDKQHFQHELPAKWWILQHLFFSIYVVVAGVELFWIDFHRFKFKLWEFQQRLSQFHRLIVVWVQFVSNRIHVKLWVKQCLWNDVKLVGIGLVPDYRIFKLWVKQRFGDCINFIWIGLSHRLCFKHTL